MEEIPNDFIKVSQYNPNSEKETDEEEIEFYIDDHYEELELFLDTPYAVDWPWLESFFDPSFNIDALTEREKEGYLRVNEFYKDKIKNSIEAETYASKHANEIPQNTNYDWDNEPQGRLMVYPDSGAGLGFAVIKDPKTNKDFIKAVFPFISEGYEYPCSIQNIMLDYYHNEGEIEAFIDEDENLLVTFYDIHYLANRKFYNPDDTFKFILMGMATYVDIVENDDMISLEQNESQKEKYDIYSVVRAISKYSDNINGEAVWRMTLVLGFTPDGEDIPLDVYLTKKSLDTHSLPEEGDNVYIEAIMFGYLYDIEK